EKCSECLECKTSLRSKSDLIMHQRMHTGPYSASTVLQAVTMEGLGLALFPEMCKEELHCEAENSQDENLRIASRLIRFDQPRPPDSSQTAPVKIGP
ncbi:hypothetical protein STEG23_012628, partial [Scotinomys teguina]